MSGKEPDKKPPPPAPAPKRSGESSFGGSGPGRAAAAKAPPAASAPGKGPVPGAKPGLFDTDDEDTVRVRRSQSLSDVRKVPPATKPVVKAPAPAAKAAPAARPANAGFQKHVHASGFDDDEKTHIESLLGKVTAPVVDPDEEDDEATVTTAVHDGQLPARAVTSVDTWKAVNAPMQSKPGRRTGILYQNVIDQFACAYNQRYLVDASGKSKTHIFVWDLTRAMNCEVPHFIGGREATLPQTVDWLRLEAQSRGWKTVNATLAAAAADRGEAVLALPVETRLRTLAVVRPGGLDAAGFPRVSVAIEDVGTEMSAPDALGTRLITYLVHE